MTQEIGETQVYLMDKAFIEKLYEEGRTLSMEARDYLTLLGPIDKRSLDPITALAYASESIRMTLRTQYILCWLLAIKAVSNNEITIATALARHFDLKSLKLGAAKDLMGYENLPAHFLTVTDKVKNFYARLERLDEQIYRQVRTNQVA